MRRLAWLLIAVMPLACADEELPPVEEILPEPAAEPEPEAPAEAGPPPTGTVEALRGSATFTRGDESGDLEEGSALQSGDKVATAADSKLRIKLADDTVIAIGAETSFVLSRLETGDEGRKGRLEILAGKFWAQVQKWAGAGGSSWEFATPNAVAGVRGTTLWGDTKVDAICALDGTIEVTSLKAKKKKKKKAKTKTFKAGQCASKLSKGKTKMMKPKAKQVKQYLSEVLIEDASGDGE